MARRSFAGFVSLTLAVGVCLGQRGFFDGGFFDEADMYELPELEDPPGLVFARVQFEGRGGRGGWGGRRGAGWAHDYPRAEQNLLQMVSELTAVHTEPASHVVVQLASPDLMKYPLLYFSEPGRWSLTDDEAENLRQHLLRGGFAIFDDFDGARDWQVFSGNMAAVFPEFGFERLDESDLVYQGFFSIENLLGIEHPMGHAYPPEFLGIRDDAGRLMVVANFNNDIGDYWEWSNEGWYPIDLSREGYKLGINYVIHALTH